MKKISLFLVASMYCLLIQAQGIPDGIKLLNYSKNKSATEVFQKLYAANPNDAQTIYWFGQALIATDDVKAAKALYTKGINDVPNDPFLIVGLGHVELLEGGNINSAKQKFEQAITSTTETKGRNKGKPSAAILSAIGRANVIGHASDGSSKFGDPIYAIDKLKQAASIDVTGTDMFIYEGLANRKMGGEFGGEAVKAYEEAIARDAKNPLPRYLLGKIYISQNNKEIFEKYFNETIATDPSFPPVYLDFYNYYANKNVTLAKDYIEKYIQYAEKDCNNDFFYADYLFRAGDNQQSLAKAKTLEGTECAAKLPLLYAYNYDRLNDSVQARTNIEKYFATVTPDKIQPTDYEISIKILSRFPGSETIAVGFIQKAIDSDTSTANKLVYISQAADIFAKAKNYASQLSWLQKLNALKGTMSESDYYKITNAALNAKDYVQTVALAKNYLSAYPDKPQPATFLRKGALGLDPDSTKGMAIEPLEFLDSILVKDTAKNKKSIFNNYYYMLVYYGDKTKNYPKAIEVLDKMLEMFPSAGSEENNFAKKQKEIIQKTMNHHPTPPSTPKPPTPPKKKE